MKHPVQVVVYTSRLKVLTMQVNESRKTNEDEGERRWRANCGRTVKGEKDRCSSRSIKKTIDASVFSIITYGGRASSSSSSSSSFLLLLNLLPMIYPSFAGEAGPGLQKKADMASNISCCRSQAPRRANKKSKDLVTDEQCLEIMPQFLAFCLCPVHYL